MRSSTLDRSRIKMKLRNVLLCTSVVAISLLVAVLLSEIALRLMNFEFYFYPSKVQIGWPDPITIKYLYKPDKDLLWVPKDYAERISLRRDISPSLVLLGCSCTQFGKYDQFLAKTISTQHPDSEFTSVNLGVGGWSSYQGLHQLKRDVVPMKPRVITIYYGWNDHWCTFGIEDKYIRQFNLDHPERLLTLSVSSRAVQLINKTMFSISFQDKRSSQRVSREDFRANLKEIVRISRKHSIIPVLLTAPSAHQPGQEPTYLADRWLKDITALVPLHESYAQAVRDVALEDNVYMVDLYRLFRDLPVENIKESFQTDGIHLTDVGAKRIADYLYEYFVQTGIMKELLARE